MFVISILSFKCNITANDTCSNAYIKYISCFNMTYQEISQENDQAKDQFCSNFKSLIDLSPFCKTCDITGIMNIPEHKLHLKQLTMKKKLTNHLSSDPVNCQEYLCYSEDSLAVLPQIYSSVDLREANLITPAKNQQGCGSCWAFGTVAVLENSILLDRANLPNFWNLSNQELNLSEQFILSNTYGYAEYCNGGDFAAAMQYIQEHFQSVELASNYPYKYSNYKTQHFNEELLPLLLPSTSYLLPYKIQNAVQSAQILTPVINLFYDESQNFDSAALAAIRSYLSRGLAVSAAMYVGTGNSKFIMYNGLGPISQPCPVQDADHQVTIIGYGKKNGTDVWVVKNSWGPDWGASGSFYVPVGGNDFCIERYAFAVLPKHYNRSSEQYQDIGDHLNRGAEDLDSDDGGLVQNDGAVGIKNNQKPPWVWWAIGAGVVFTVAGAVVVVWAVVVRAKKVRVMRGRERIV